MSLFPHFGGQIHKHWGFALALLLFGIALETSDANAQSGRRAAKTGSPVSPKSPAPVVPTENPEEEKPLRPGELPSKVHLLVARQSTAKHLHSEDQILASFIKQLNRYENIEAVPIGDVKGDQAVERAKAETDAFVILITFDIDRFQGGTIVMNSQDLEIEYFVLAPRTGKKQTKGKVYFQGIGGGRMRKQDWPNGTPIRITPEATGIEAADGLYFWLRLATVRKASQ